MIKRDLIIGEKSLIFVFMVFSVVTLIASIQILLKDPTFSSPGAFPVIVSVILTGTSVAAWREIKNFSPKAATKNESNKMNAIVPKDVISILILLLVYSLILSFVGFEIATFLFLFASMTYFRRHMWKNNIIISVGSILVIIFLFSVVFKVILP
jgi:hypothetical protein